MKNYIEKKILKTGLQAFLLMVKIWNPCNNIEYVELA